jgi:hypothetical protein
MSSVNFLILLPVWITFFVAWLYRLTIKSTAWFWWPLAFLGDEPRRASNPDLFEWKITGSLWAKSSIILACGSITTFIVAHILFNGVLSSDNPLLTVFGYLLTINWSLGSWQILAITASVMTIVIVFLVNDVAGEYRIAEKNNDGLLRLRAANKLIITERLTRIRLIVVVLGWLLVGGQALLYFNSIQCWVTIPPRVERWSVAIYEDRVPRGDWTCRHMHVASASGHHLVSSMGPVVAPGTD